MIVDKVLAVFKKVYRAGEGLKALLFGWIEGIKEAKAPTYYPDYPRKTFIERYWDQLKWIFSRREVNHLYCLYGLDVKGMNDPKDYVDYMRFAHERDDGNYLGGKTSQIVMLRDKLLFSYFADACSIPVPETFAAIDNGSLLVDGKYDSDWSKIENETDYFCKAVNGECASFVKHIADYEDLCTYRQTLNNGVYILQRRVQQHEIMQQFNPYAINTIRIVTAKKGSEVYVFSAVLRLGTEATGYVDNFKQGGLAVGIKEDGTLKKYGYYKPGYSKNPKTDRHPDSNILFEGFQIPYYSEVVELVIRAHGHLNHVQTIGWDVAISPEGPVIVEGNDNWAINLMQGCNGGLRKEWQKLQSK